MFYTRSKLTKEIRAVISKTHAIAKRDIKITWLINWVLTRYPTGLIAMVGEIEIAATGFKTRIFCIEQEPNKRWYMR